VLHKYILRFHKERIKIGVGEAVELQPPASIKSVPGQERLPTLHAISKGSGTGERFMQQYRVRNWERFQHYKDRNPPWIRLHRSILDDYDFHCLPDASRALAPCLWLLASESDDPSKGTVHGPDERIAFRLRMTAEKFRESVKPLIDKGFIELLRADSSALAGRKHGATPETEAEKETEKDNAPPVPPVPQEPKNGGGVRGIPNTHPRFNEVWEYIVGRLPHLKRSDNRFIGEWLDAGADPEDDIFPTVDHEIGVKGNDIGSFKYFDRQVRSAHAARREAAEQLERLKAKHG
jgi:hypothetical protein